MNLANALMFAHVLKNWLPGESVVYLHRERRQGPAEGLPDQLQIGVYLVAAINKQCSVSYGVQSTLGHCVH